MEHFYQSIPGYFTFQDFYTYAACGVSDDPFWRGVEVGVNEGQSAAFLAVELLKWQNIVTGAHPTLTLVESSPAFMQSAMANLKDVPLSIGWLRLLSTEAAKSFEDHSLSFVFIDADHSYEAVRADIDAWLPKVRRGGIIAGHDFNDQFPGVIRAVCETFSRFEIWRGTPFTDGKYYPVWSVEV